MKTMTQKSLNFASNIIWLTVFASVGVLMGRALDFSRFLDNGVSNADHNFWAWGLVLGMLTYQGIFFYNLQKFGNWLNKHSQDRPPNFARPFQKNLEVLANHIYQANRQEQQAHQQTMGLIHKVRGSLSAITDTVLLINDKGGLEWWNHSAQAMLGLTTPDQGRPIVAIIRSPLFHEYFHEPEKYHEGVRLTSWQDSERYVQCEITQFGQEKLIVIYDVTRLAHLEQMRKDFVANVSHELRTPLTVIMGYMETLSEQTDMNPRWQRAFNQMIQQSHRMNNIINDLLLLSRLENDEKPAEMTAIDMPKLLMELFDDSQIYNKSYNHLIHLHIDSQKQVLGYEKYLTSALSNLITNAIKYTPLQDKDTGKKQGEISINWYEKDGGVCFSVKDNGIGIEGRHIERLTERFYRVDSGRSRETGGTGLGLAIVKHVLYQHGATLEVTSKVGEGSTFSVFFPKEKVVN